MGFFDQLPPIPDPEPEPPEPPLPLWMRPDAVLPGIVTDSLLLVHTPDVAVAVDGLRAYPTGLEFTLCVVLRRDDRRRRILDYGLLHRVTRYPDEPLPDEFLRLGVRFADGRIATNLGHPGRFTDPAPDGPLLMPDGGGGGGRRYDMMHWIWPLPPAGPMTFVCQWPVFGIAESHGDIDAELILEAASRARQLWPDSDAPA